MTMSTIISMTVSMTTNECQILWVSLLLNERHEKVCSSDFIKQKITECTEIVISKNK